MFKCKECDREFEKQIQLASHSNSHKKEECSCRVCGKEFDSQTKLKGHLSSHNRKSKPPKIKEEKKFICHFCGLEFDKGQRLGGHLSTCKLNPNDSDRLNKIKKALTGKKLSEEHKNKVSIGRKKYLDENPGQIPYLLNHSSKESYPEKIFRERLELEGINGWIQEYPVLRYSLDFAFIDSKLDVEIDGGTHNLPDVILKDEIRTNNLISKGWRVFRISDYDIKNNLDGKIVELLSLL